jgi:hypothetical protein
MYLKGLCDLEFGLLAIRLAAVVGDGKRSGLRCCSEQHQMVVMGCSMPITSVAAYFGTYSDTVASYHIDRTYNTEHITGGTHAEVLPHWHVCSTGIPSERVAAARGTAAGEAAGMYACPTVVNKLCQPYVGVLFHRKQLHTSGSS